MDIMCLQKVKKMAVLHIHGFEGNFYENNFIYSLINVTDGNWKKIGARYELLEEAHLDISAWIQFLIDEGYEQIILMDHSLGTVKVVRYLFEGEYKNKISKLILLCPFDKKGLMIASNRNIEDLLIKAEIQINQGNGNELVTKEFEDIEISYKTFISWYKQDDLGRMFEFSSKNYDFPILKQIKVQTKIIVGSKDEYFYQSNPGYPEEAMEILLKNIPNSKGRIIKQAVHSFKPHENEMAKEIREFVNPSLR